MLRCLIQIMEPLLKVGNRMTLYAKKYKLQHFVCPKCKAKKKSGLGYLSHLEVSFTAQRMVKNCLINLRCYRPQICGLSPEEIASTFHRCPHCPAQIRQVSVASHLTTCVGLRQKRSAEKPPSESLEPCSPIVGGGPEAMVDRQNNAGRSERRSAAKARTSFKELENADETPDDVSVACVACRLVFSI